MPDRKCSLLEFLQKENARSSQTGNINKAWAGGTLTLESKKKRFSWSDEVGGKGTSGYKAEINLRGGNGVQCVSPGCRVADLNSDPPAKREEMKRSRGWQLAT